MNVEVDQNVEKVIKAGLASGQFESPTDAVAAMARAWLKANSNHAAVRRPLPEKTDIAALAAEHGVRPFDSAEPVPEFWPQDESADDFLEFVREIRQDDPAR
jgi:hypothetical protein